MLSSSGRCGSACNARRRWFVEVEEVRVELGFVAVRVVMSEALADRIPSTQASRSSSLAKATLFSFSAWKGSATDTHMHAM